MLFPPVAIPLPNEWFAPSNYSRSQMYSLSLPSQQYQYQYNDRSLNCCSSRSIWRREKKPSTKKQEKRPVSEKETKEKLSKTDTTMAGLAVLLSGFSQFYTTYPVPTVATILPPTPITTAPTPSRAAEGRNLQVPDTGRVQWSPCTNTTSSAASNASRTGLNTNSCLNPQINQNRSLSVDSGYQPRASFASSRPPTPFPASLIQTPTSTTSTTEVKKSRSSSQKLAKRLKKCFSLFRKSRKPIKVIIDDELPVFTYTPISPTHPPLRRPHPGNPVIVTPSLDDDELMNEDAVEAVFSSSMSISSAYSQNSCDDVDGRTVWRRCPTLIYTSSFCEEGRRVGRESDATLVG